MELIKGHFYQAPYELFFLYSKHNEYVHTQTWNGGHQPSPHQAHISDWKIVSRLIGHWRHHSSSSDLVNQKSLVLVTDYLVILASHTEAPLHLQVGKACSCQMETIIFLNVLQNNNNFMPNYLNTTRLYYYLLYKYCCCQKRKKQNSQKQFQSLPQLRTFNSKC